MSIKKIVSEFTQLSKTFFREFVFVYKMAPKYSLALTLIQTLIGILPAAELIVGAKIIDEIVVLFGSGEWSKTLITLVVLLLGLLGLQRIIFLINDYVMNYLRGYLQIEVNDRIHKTVIGFDLPTLERSSVHTLVTYLKEQAWRPVQLVYSVFQLFGNLIASVSFVVIAFTFSPIFTFLFVLAVLPSVIITSRAIAEGQEIAWGKAALMKKVWYYESLFRLRQSLVELMVHNVGTHFANLYRKTFTKVLDKEVVIEKKKLVGSLVANIAAWIVFIFVYTRVIFAALIGVISIGQFTLYVGAYRSLERFMVSQVWQISMLYEHTRYLDSFRKLQNIKPAITDSESVKKLTEILCMELRNVSFRYQRSDQDAVSSVSFSLKPGERIALVGENGAGKSTIVKLLLRLYEPTSGTILINGEDYRNFTLESLREQVGVTFQDFLQFSLSAKENISVGDMRYWSDLTAIEKAAERAGIHKKITQLPNGYESVLGHEFHEDGVELSGGEWQKIALARSLIKDASLLILDEPTAALDARSEYEFFKELFKKAKGQSLLLISHRFSSVRIADRIIVLKNGKIIEEGTHQKLILKKGLYEDLCTLQTKEIKQ